MRKCYRDDARPTSLLSAPSSSSSSSFFGRFLFPPRPPPPRPLPPRPRPEVGGLAAVIAPPDPVLAVAAVFIIGVSGLAALTPALGTVAAPVPALALLVPPLVLPLGVAAAGGVALAYMGELGGRRFVGVRGVLSADGAGDAEYTELDEEEKVGEGALIGATMSRNSV